MEYNIIHNAEQNRFETTVDGLVSVVDYTQEGHVLVITHTGVPQELEGRGIAAAITKFMLQYVRNNQLKVRAVCPYTATYLVRHPEYSDLTV